ncbi:UNVERIFIED_CONTAM: LOB domain-containing protein 21 [Sesamum radiatum]|uniref:LOB domain-containing protein 21 n=1 Tax=Sesamum radiatum TaxID=300843 RepID=A0AAW2JZX8_SESRA
MQSYERHYEGSSRTSFKLFLRSLQVLEEKMHPELSIRPQREQDPERGGRGATRETVNSLVYEAEVRLQDPVYGCIGAIASLQHKMVELQHDLILARARLACYVDQQQRHDSESFFDIDHVNMAPLVDIQEPSAGVVDAFDYNALPFDQFSPFQFP